MALSVTRGSERIQIYWPGGQPGESKHGMVSLIPDGREVCVVFYPSTVRKNPEMKFLWDCIIQMGGIRLDTREIMFKTVWKDIMDYVQKLNVTADGQHLYTHTYNATVSGSNATFIDPAWTSTTNTFTTSSLAYPPTRPKPKTNLDWLREAVEEMAAFGREELKVA